MRNVRSKRSIRNTRTARNVTTSQSHRKDVEQKGKSRRFLSVDEAASLLEVNRDTIIHLIHRKKIMAMQVGSQWRIPRVRFFAQFPLLNDPDLPPAA